MSIGIPAKKVRVKMGFYATVEKKQQTGKSESEN
jgi:hypothetical protein